MHRLLQKLATIVVSSLVLGSVALNGVAAGTVHPDATGAKLAQDSAAGAGNDLGIVIVGLSLSGADYMIDFRYRVTDPIKAARLINKKNKPVLIDEKSGARVVVPFFPKLGAMRHTGGNLKKGKMYFALFANPGRFIKKGARVTIKLGKVELKHLVIS